eukprot:gene10157-10315_t
MKKEKNDDNIDTIELLDDEDDAAFWQNLNIKSEKKRTHEQQERQQLLDQVASLQADKQHLQQQLAEYTTLRQAHEQLQQCMSTLQPLPAQLERSAALLRQREIQLAAMGDQHRQALSDLQQQLSDSEQFVAAANSRNHGLDAQLQASQQQAQDFKQEAEQNRLQAEENRMQAEQYKSQVESMRGNGCTKDSCRFQDELRTFEDALKTEQAKNAQCEVEKKMLLDSVAKLLATNRGLQEQLAAQKGLREFLQEAGVSSRDMAGVIEKSDLLALAKSRVQLWEARRINHCGQLMADPSTLLMAAMAVFRIACGPQQDPVAAVKQVKDALLRSYKRLALQVHPDKAIGALQVLKPVFSEAFKTLNNANDLLGKVAAGQVAAGPGQQPGPAAAAAAAATAGTGPGTGPFYYTYYYSWFPGGAGFAGPGGFPGAGQQPGGASGPAPGPSAARKQRGAAAGGGGGSKGRARGRHR